MLVVDNLIEAYRLLRIGILQTLHGGTYVLGSFAALAKHPSVMVGVLLSL